MAGNLGGFGSAVGGIGSALGGIGPVSLANWSLPANTSETIVSLQPVDLPAIYLAIYRITNLGVESRAKVVGSVQVQTDHGKFGLEPGRSIDISTQTITIRSKDKPARGTYQLLCYSLAGKRET